MIMALPGLILLLAGLGFVGFGLAYAVRPRPMGGLTDVAPATPTALADFLATYGGFQIGFGGFLVVCTRVDGWLEPGLFAASAALAGFALLRSVGILLAGNQVRRTIWLGLGLEVAGLALTLSALAQVR